MSGLALWRACEALRNMGLSTHTPGERHLERSLALYHKPAPGYTPPQAFGNTKRRTSGAPSPPETEGAANLCQTTPPLLLRLGNQRRKGVGHALSVVLGHKGCDDRG